MKIYIPKNKKIVSKKQSVDIISKFEINIFKDYNSGKIPYPIHLSKGNEIQLTKIFLDIFQKKIGFVLLGEIMHMLCFMGLIQLN